MLLGSFVAPFPFTSDLGALVESHSQLGILTALSLSVFGVPSHWAMSFLLPNWECGWPLNIVWETVAALLPHPSISIQDRGGVSGGAGSEGSSGGG